MVANPSSNGAEFVTIPKVEYARLLLAADKLEALEVSGVDNWGWYGEAMRSMNKGEDTDL